MKLVIVIHWRSPFATSTPGILFTLCPPLPGSEPQAVALRCGSCAPLVIAFWLALASGEALAGDQGRGDKSGHLAPSCSGGCLCSSTAPLPCLLAVTLRWSLPQLLPADIRFGVQFRPLLVSSPLLLLCKSPRSCLPLIQESGSLFSAEIYTEKMLMILVNYRQEALGEKLLFFSWWYQSLN
jgi:hypothetical protein